MTSDEKQFYKTFFFVMFIPIVGMIAAILPAMMYTTDLKRIITIDKSKDTLDNFEIHDRSKPQFYWIESRYHVKSHLTGIFCLIWVPLHGILCGLFQAWLSGRI